jgi:hypothetical protein
MIHVLFSSSAAGTLRQLLHARGVRQRVVVLSETFEWGPISNGNFEDRQAWLDRHAPNEFGGWGWLAADVAEFQEKVAADAERLIWIAPRSASEQSGLYWYLAQFGGAGAQMILADYPLRDAWRGEPPRGLGELQEEAIGQLLDECPRLPLQSARFPEGRWKRLMAEDALIRVVDGGVLGSAPEDYFDRFLLEHCPVEWTRWNRVIGDAMVNLGDIGHSVSDMLLHWRLCELVAREEVRCDGEPPVYGAAGSRELRVRR